MVLSQRDLTKAALNTKSNNAKLILNEKSLASYSNTILEKFSFGYHCDNALLYCIRINNLEFFSYFIDRGIKISTSN